MKTKKGFGKKEDNTYRIIEHTYKDDSVKFFVEITDKFGDNCFGFSTVTIYDETFYDLDSAKACVVELIEKDRRVTILEEKFHSL
jgi:hypothetical protein